MSNSRQRISYFHTVQNLIFWWISWSDVRFELRHAQTSALDAIAKRTRIDKRSWRVVKPKRAVWYSCPFVLRTLRRLHSRAVWNARCVALVAHTDASRLFGPTVRPDAPRPGTLRGRYGRRVFARTAATGGTRRRWVHYRSRSGRCRQGRPAVVRKSARPSYRNAVRTCRPGGTHRSAASDGSF